jgi:hypothetical protein
MTLYSRRYSTMKSTFLVVVSGVNDTADHKSDPLLTPPPFLYECCRHSVVQFAYVQCFDRNSFKSSQSTLIFEVPWSAVSILVSGVIDTTEFLYKFCIVESAVSLTPPS